MLRVPSWVIVPSSGRVQLWVGPAIERQWVGSRARGERHLRLVAPPPPPSPYVTDEWQQFEGAGSPAPPTWGDLLADRTPIVVTDVMLERINLAQVVRSAVDAISAP